MSWLRSPFFDLCVLFYLCLLVACLCCVMSYKCLLIFLVLCFIIGDAFSFVYFDCW